MGFKAWAAHLAVHGTKRHLESCQRPCRKLEAGPIDECCLKKTRALLLQAEVGASPISYLQMGITSLAWSKDAFESMFSHSSDLRRELQLWLHLFAAIYILLLQHPAILTCLFDWAAA
jgi:hypothetical protein